MLMLTRLKTAKVYSIAFWFSMGKAEQRYAASF